MNQPSTRKYILGVLLLSVFFSLGGCRGDVDAGDPGLVLSVAIAPTPPMVGEARLIISLTDTAEVPIPDAFIEVEGNMSHAGMIPVFDTATAEDPGRYAVPDFNFTMAGDWILDVMATLPDGRWVRTRKPASVVGRTGGTG